MENQIKPDEKSKVLIVLFFALIIISIFLTYKRTIIERDYPTIDMGETEETN